VSDNAKTNQNNNDVLSALRSIANAVSGQELQAIRNSVSSTEARLSRHIDDVQAETAKSIDSLKSEMMAQLDSFSKKLDDFKKDMSRNLSDQDSKTNAAIKDVKDMLSKSEAATKDSLEQVKTSLKKEAVAKHDMVTKEFIAVQERLDAQDQELQVRKVEAKQVSNLMSNFARIFSGSSADADLPQMAAAAKPKSAAKTSAKNAESDGQGSNGSNDLPDSNDFDAQFDSLFNQKK
jgi:small-conductance mechanosensitive channel